MLNLYHLKFATGSVLIHPDGRLENVSPKNGEQWKLKEVVHLLGDDIDQIDAKVLYNSQIVWNNRAILKLADHNVVASDIAGRSVCGPALFIHPKHRANLTEQSHPA